MDIGQTVMIGIVLLVVFVGGYFVFKPSSADPQRQATQSVIVTATPQAVNVDGALYTLRGVSWVFEAQAADENGAPATRVRLRLNGFERNNSPIDVALYRLGTYRGACADAAVIDPAMLALAECRSGDVVRQLAAFQDDRLITVQARTVSEYGLPREEFVPILSIDLAEIIAPAS